MPTVTPKQKDSYLHVLEDAGKLAKSVLSKCSRTKNLHGIRLWVVALAAKAGTTGQAIHTLLIANKCTGDSKLLLRSLFDALIDLLYLQADPTKTKELLRLLSIEIVVDQHEELKFRAITRKMSVAEFVERNPELRKIVEEYEKVKKDQTHAQNRGGTQKGRSSERWRNIGIREKLKAIQGFNQAFRPFGYTIRTLANANAHHRPVGLREFFYRQKDGTAGVRTCPPPQHFMYSSAWISFETSLILLVMCDQLITEFFLGKDLEQRFRRMMDRLRALQKTKLASGTRKHDSKLPI